MTVREELLPVNPFSRPGHKRTDDFAVVLHWTGAAGQENDLTRRYFELLAKQEESDERPNRYASAHYIIGIDGEILRVIPEDEVAYHVGAAEYTVVAKRRFPEYTTNRAGGTPNWCSIGIELCHPTSSGEFTRETVEAARILCFDILNRIYLGPYSLMRHYDITGKRCPKRWIEDAEQWERFVQHIEEMRKIRR